MASRSEKRKATLQELRERFNKTDALASDQNDSKDYATLVQEEVNQIERLDHHKKIRNWGNRCRAERNKKNYTIEDVAELIGVSHTSITNQEQANEETTVDLFYLEAFSLIYQTHPYFLLDGKDCKAVAGKSAKRGAPYFPIVSVDTKYQRFCNIVMNTLFVEDDPDKLAYLRALTTFAKMNMKCKDELINSLSLFPVFEEVKTTDVSNVATADNSYLMFYMPPLILLEQHTTAEYEYRLTFWEARRALENLRDKCSDYLELLAQMALATGDTKAFIFTVITKGGYPKGGISLQKYNLDSLIFKDAKVKASTGKRTKGGVF